MKLEYCPNDVAPEVTSGWEFPCWEYCITLLPVAQHCPSSLQFCTAVTSALTWS